MPLIGDGFELYATFPQFNQFMHTQRNRIANVYVFFYFNLSKFIFL